MTSTVSTTIEGTASEVWDTLADGWLYGLWVVGASRIRDVDGSWPAPGSKIHHSVGSWPLVIDDTTSVVTCEADRRLVLQARAWPSGEAQVDITIEEQADGTLVSMSEDATHGPALLVPSVVRRAVLDRRNTESLKRLTHLVEHRTRPGS
ncbi:MAG: SRPBCC family protein [Nocardioidaceae bacterium]